MSEKGLTNISVKKINRSKVYQYIYRKKITSKLQIVQDLQMGLVHRKPESEPVRAGWLNRKKWIFRIHRRKKSKCDSDCI